MTGGHLVLPTSPDGSADRGLLAFAGGRRFGLQVADSGGANKWQTNWARDSSPPSRMNSMAFEVGRT